jgi:TolB-like protein/Tfp pilus assembly protein PilF
MTEFWQSLKQRKLVQWAVAYVAAAFALLQGIDIVAQHFGWPESASRFLIIASCIGFFVTLLLAWYHGERGVQKVSGTELLLLALLLAIGGGLLWKFAPVSSQPADAGKADHGSAPASAPAPGAKNSVLANDKSIAVLPFENLSSDKDNAYFATGMQDEILTRLAGIHDLKVISRTSTEQYASRPPNLRIVAEQLGVATVLEGSVQRADGKVRINLQLIDARNDSHLWAQNYDRDLKDVFAVQSDVAEKVADALKAKLLPAESARIANVPTQNPEAYDLYLKARYRFSELQTSSSKDPVATGKDATDFYQRAIAADPGFALAYVWLSYLQSYLHWYGVDNSPDIVDAARTNAKKALELQPGLAEAHLAMGYVHYWGHRDYPAALSEFAVARASLPNNPEVLAAIGYVVRRQGDPTFGIPEMQQASLLDPRNSLLPREIADSYVALRRYDEADYAFARSLAVFPGDIEAQVQRVTGRIYSGDIESAERMLAAIPAEMDPQGTVSLMRFRLQMLLRRPDAALTAVANAPPWLLGRFEHSAVPLALLRGQALAMKGDSSASRAALLEAVQLLQEARKNPVTEVDALSHLGLAYAGLGQKQAALESGRAAVARLPLSRDSIVGAYNLERLARVEAQTGETGAAIGHLQQLLGAAAGETLSVATLRIDPVWDPLRKDARFLALLRSPPVAGKRGQSHFPADALCRAATRRPRKMTLTPFRQICDHVAYWCRG